MAENNVQIEQQGIKCDAKECDYTYIFKEDDTYTKFLNAPCPKCGENLLTQEDHDMMMMVLAQIEEMNMEGFEMPTIPQEIQDLIDSLEDPHMKTYLDMDFVDGVPVLTSKNPEVQSILTRIEEYFAEEAEFMQKLSDLENE